MKRAVVGILVLSMLLLSACSSSGPGKDTIRIGLIAPLTGEVKTFGESSKKGFDLAIEQAGGKVGNLKIETVIGDDRKDPNEGKNLATKMATKDKVSAIVGSVTSGVTIPVSEVANKYKVVMITGTATNADVTVDPKTGRKPFAFRACFIDPFQGQVAAKFALENLKVKTAVIFYDKGNAYTVGLSDAFKANFEKGGGQVISMESYSETDTDFSAVMTKVAGMNPGMLYLPDYYPKASLIAKAAKDKGLKVPMVGGDGWDSADLDYNLLDGQFFTAHYSADDNRPEVQKFVKEFEAKYGEKPDSFAALVYDATNILLEAIRKAGSNDGEAIRKAMQELQGFPAVGGAITFDKDGNPIKAATILKVSNKKTYDFVTSIQP